MTETTVVSPSASWSFGESPSLVQIARTLRRRGFDDEDVLKMIKAWAHVSQKSLPWRPGVPHDPDDPAAGPEDNLNNCRTCHRPNNKRSTAAAKDDVSGKKTSRAAKKLQRKRQLRASQEEDGDLHHHQQVSTTTTPSSSPPLKKQRQRKTFSSPRQPHQLLKTAARAAQTVSRLKIACGKGRPDGRDILDDFAFLEGGKLGCGAHAVVYVVRSRTTKRLFACKCIKKELMGPAQRRGLLQEAALMRSIDHSGIVKLWHLYEDDSIYYLVMDLIQGGELFHRVVRKSSYTECEARDATRKLLSAVAYLHDRGIVHRDIKPENLLCVSRESDTEIKLCDFGFATRLDATNPTKCLTRVCGTTSYLAPEVLSHRAYGAACDLWSVGCVVFILLSGYPPFFVNASRSSDTKNWANILQGNYTFHSPYWDNVSDTAKHFVSRLLDVEPDTRLTAAQALDHPWLTEDAKTLEERDLTATALPELKKYNARKTFRSTVGGVIAAKRLARGHTTWVTPTVRPQ